MKAIRPILVLLLATAVLRAQVVVDRIIAVVNKHVVLESELDQAVRVELLLTNQPLSRADLIRSPVLEQLIDRSLLEQQISDLDTLPPEELAARLTLIRQEVKGAESDQGWDAALGAYGVSRRDVERHLNSEFRILRLIDVRFRGVVHVDQAAIAAYYNDKLLPQLGGQAPTPLSEVSSKIEEILVEQRVDAMLSEWLRALRGQAHIQRMAPFDNPVLRESHP